MVSPNKIKSNALVVSYFPLLSNRFSLMYGHTPIDADKIGQLLDETIGENLANAKACIWGIVGGSPCIVLVLNRAQEIADDLKAWSEDDVESWFGVDICQEEDAYGIALFPDLNKSFERFNKRRRFEMLEELSRDSKYTIVFDPIRFISKGLGSFAGIKDKIGETIKVMFLESSDLDHGDLQQSVTDGLINVGEFRVRFNELSYLKQLLKEDSPPS
jgi:hypothetical protein